MKTKQAFLYEKLRIIPQTPILVMNLNVKQFAYSVIFNQSIMASVISV